MTPEQRKLITAVIVAELRSAVDAARAAGVSREQVAAELDRRLRAFRGGAR